MLVEQLEVLSWADGVAHLKVNPQSTCGNCQSRCGYKAFEGLSTQKSLILSLKVDEALKEGEKVFVGITERSFFSAIWFLYLLPLLSLIGSAVIFSYFFTNELVIFGIILTAVMATFVAINYYLKNTTSQQLIYLGKSFP